ncbi:uncharacterized protein CXorf58 homolog isoform X1 [Hemitrygon akajei]|uniref:uncharacterized protein CXorf58 homolog isoform X1 n=2 Tax=Hemitrygon akajei TaxID=2704970 RepID=UPI003BF96DCB
MIISDFGVMRTSSKRIQTSEKCCELLTMDLKELKSKSSPCCESLQKDHILLNSQETKVHMHKSELKIIDPDSAARIIQTSWISYRNKQLFRLLKHTICAAEHCLTTDILRKLQPSEAELLKDIKMAYKVRFRFAGEEFPPFLVFKIFQHTGNYKNQYLSGKRIIKPATEAAAASCKIMGRRKFYDLIIQDNLQYQRMKVADEADIVTAKDYMQYASNLDETPACLGGRENYWRMLTLTNLPRTTIMYDIVDYAYSRTLSQRLKEELPILLSRPSTERIQLQHIRTLSQTRSASPVTQTLPHRTSKLLKAGKESQRRSHKARMKVSKMRKVYGLDKNKEEEKKTSVCHSPALDDSQFYTSSDQEEKDEVTHLTSEEEWEHEVDKLYAWTQKLSLDLCETPFPD